MVCVKNKLLPKQENSGSFKERFVNSAEYDYYSYHFLFIITKLQWLPDVQSILVSLVLGQSDMEEALQRLNLNLDVVPCLLCHPG